VCRRDDYCHVSNKVKSFVFFVFYVCLCYVSPSVSFFYLAMSVFLLFWPVHTFASSCLMFCQVSVYVAVPSSFYSNECLALLFMLSKDNFARSLQGTKELSNKGVHVCAYVCFTSKDVVALWKHAVLIHLWLLLNHDPSTTVVH
jgi:sulfur transfer complex TusBCD TusB component (DsrH family)